MPGPLQTRSAPYMPAPGLPLKLCTKRIRGLMSRHAPPIPSHTQHEYLASSRCQTREQSRVKTQILASCCVSDYSWSQSPHRCVRPPTYGAGELASKFWSVFVMEITLKVNWGRGRDFTLVTAHRILDSNYSLVSAPPGD